jgi:hypothetical protein
MAEANWVVTEVRAGDSATDASQTATRVAEILRARGVAVIDAKSAASEIEHKHSRTPVRLRPEELERLDQALRTLANHLASENLAEARVALEQVERLTPDARDYLNRQVNRARRRFHTCLLAAHLFAKEGYDEDAFQQVRKCARDFPGFEPDEGEYMPDSIKSFFKLAREELESIRPATLDVRVTEGSAQQCRARVNGIDKGTLPAKITDVRADAVRVQLDCEGRSGRIYNVPVKPGNNELVIDPWLDRALDTSGTLMLHYPSAEAAGALREKHGFEIARAIGAGQILEVFGGRLTRLDVASRTRVDEADLASGSIEDAVDSVLRARGEEQPVAVSEDPAFTDPVSSRSSVLAPLAWVSVGAAVAAGATFVVGWRVREPAAKRFSDPSCVDPDDPRRLTRGEKCADDYDTAKTGEAIMITAGIAAGVFGGLATLFFLLDGDDGAEQASTARTNPCHAGPGDLGVACTVAF